MKTLDHPNIIKLFETYDDPRNVYLVLEYFSTIYYNRLCEGGELFERIVSKGSTTES